MHKQEDCMEPTLFELILSIKRKCLSNEEKIQNELKLTPAEFNGLLVLFPKEEILGSVFAERMRLSPSRGSRVLGRLMKGGYVQTDSKPENRRSVFISLTQSGLQMKKKIVNRMQTCENQICSPFSRKEIESMKQTLIQLEQALS